MCFPRMEESRDHELRAQKSRDIIRRHQDEIVLSKCGQKHSKPEEQARKEHKGKEGQ